MYKIKQHSIPVEQLAGHSHYIRIRFFLDQYPSAFDINQYTKAIHQWMKKYEEKKLKILDCLSFLIYRTPAFEINFDIAKASEEAIDELIDFFVDLQANPQKTANLGKALVAYYDFP